MCFLLILIGCRNYPHGFWLHGWKLSGLFLNSGFWGWLSTESQPHNPELGRLLWLFDLISVYLKTIDHLNLKLLIFIGILQVLRFDFQKFRIFKILNFHPCDLSYCINHCPFMANPTGTFLFRLWIYSHQSYHTGPISRSSGFVACKQQSCIPACTV